MAARASRELTALILSRRQGRRRKREALHLRSLRQQRPAGALSWHIGACKRRLLTDGSRRALLLRGRHLPSVEVLRSDGWRSQSKAAQRRLWTAAC
jgi:hypothetical protein